MINDEALAKKADDLIREGKMKEGMQLMYEMLTDDIDLTCEPSDTTNDIKSFVLGVVLTYFSAPAVEDYEKCAVLRDIKSRIEAQ